MKTAKQLKKVLDVFYYLIFFSLIATISMFTYFLAFKGINPLRGGNEPVDSLQWFDIIWSLVLLGLFSGFLWGTFYLRKAVKILMQGNYFTVNVIDNIKKAGNVFTIFGILATGNHIISQLILNKILWLGIDYEIIGFLFILVMGLFFKLLSVILSEAKTIKDENNLTV